jgi:hypothetical protein
MDSITVISVTATLAMAGSATGALTMAASDAVMRFTEVQTFTLSRERIPAGSVALVTAEMLEDFPRAGTPALEEAAASTAVVGMAVVVITK